MTDEQIRNLVKQEVAKASSADRFRLSPTNRHVHNNTDAPFVFLPYAIYGGFVPYDGNTVGLLESILPKGWSVTKNGTGDFTITHNIGTANYVFVTVPNQSTNVVCSPVVETFKNEVDIGWFDTTTARTDTSFNFILLVLNSISDTFPTYVNNNVPNI